MSKSLSTTFPQHLFHSNFKGNINLTEQMQEHIVKLQQALEIEFTLRRISETVRASLDEAFTLKAAVQELALELKADCYAVLLSDAEQQIFTSDSLSLDPSLGYQPKITSLHNPEIDQQLREGSYLQFCFNPSPSQGKLTLFVCPIVNNDKNLGSLWVIQEVSRTLSDSEIYLVQQVAKQCAIAIDQSRLYQAAQKEVKELKELNEVKDDFLSQVIHDLRSPLANMRLVIHMLEHQLTTEKPHGASTTQSNSAYSKTLTHLTILRTECEREITLVNNLLDLQGLESEKQPLNLDAIDLKSWLTALVQSFEERLQQRHLTLNLHIDPNLPTLISDSASLHRVLSELLHNACKYTPPHEIISLKVLLNSDHVQIQVSNSGVEIPAEELSRIFDKFYRIPGSDRWKQGGTGLGLALVQKLVQHLGSSIQVKSGSRQTCFAIELPLKPIN